MHNKVHTLTNPWERRLKIASPIHAVHVNLFQSRYEKSLSVHGTIIKFEIHDKEETLSDIRLITAILKQSVRIKGDPVTHCYSRGAIDKSLRTSQEPKPPMHGAPPPVDKLFRGYPFFFFSCLASFFSLADLCGFFFSDFLVSCDLDMRFPSLVQVRDFRITSSFA
jgi:hypothetical protein